MKQLLVDYLPFQITPQQINESLSQNGGRLVVKGVLQRADAKNQNGRRYPKHILTREAQKYNELIKQRRALGELDHPETSVINLKNVCHNITKMWWEGKDLFGEFEILDTPSGNILKELFLAGINVGVSSRAMGSVTPIGEGLVQVGEDLELIGWDFVSTPSTYGAYTHMTPETIAANGLRENYVPKINNKQDLVSRLISEIICTQSGVCCIK